MNLSVAKTAAASVEATTAPSSTDSSHDRSKSNTPRPVRTVDATTPTVASRVAGTATLRSLRHDVEKASLEEDRRQPGDAYRPRELCVVELDSARTVEPSSIPSARKATRDGTPTRAAPSATMMLPARIAPTTSNASFRRPRTYLRGSAAR